MLSSAARDEITPHELAVLDSFFTQERRRYAESLKRERAAHGPRTRRLGLLADALRRLDTLHARVRAHSGQGPIWIDPHRDDAGPLRELKAIHRALG